MKYVIQFLIIILFSFIGEIFHYILPLPVPASIYGIILLFIALETKIVKVKDIREVSMFLIAVMPVMFVPAAVGLIDTWDSIEESAVQYLVVILVSTIMVMASAGIVTQYVIRKGKEQRK